MRASAFFMPTLREVPAEAEVASHQLLMRAGFIRKSAAGVYTFLPLALRVLKKIERIVREEMDRAGGLEIQLPILQTADLWHRSGRWNVYGPELMRLKDRHGRDFCLGPTHEEIVTELVKGEVRSYKQLPLLLYQIQNKYRDEKRPRFGLLRGREFIMKDLYSFDRDETGLEESYRKMYEAYTRVFTRCGLEFRVVEADPGAIGGNVSHEFMALAAAGEATVIYCPACGYAANAEKAESRSPEAPTGEGPKGLELVETPGMRTVEEVTSFLGVPPQKIIKTLLYETDRGLVAALVRGDREVNEVKLQQVVGTLRLELAQGATVEEATGAPVGFAGPVGLSLPLVVDREVAALVNAVSGANAADAHYVNVNPGRDFPLDRVVDIRLAAAGDGCTRCGEPLAAARGIEVGQLFKLGDKYSKVMGATFLDENGQERPFIMGCYGIGVSRTMAAAVEQHHDEHGIIWPPAIAPFEVVVLPVNNKNEVQVELAEKIYRMLVTAGYDTILDDRTERPGVKFKDADLIGYPVRVTVGQKAGANQVEVRLRRTGETTVVAVDKVCATVAALLRG